MLGFPLMYWSLLTKHQYILASSSISQQWDGSGSWNPSSWKIRIYLSDTVDAMAADDLATRVKVTTLCAASDTKCHQHDVDFQLWQLTVQQLHYNDVIMGSMASQITSLTIVYSSVYSGIDQRKQQSSASLVSVWGIHRGWWIPRTNGQ